MCLQEPQITKEAKKNYDLLMPRINIFELGHLIEMPDHGFVFEVILIDINEIADFLLCFFTLFFSNHKPNKMTLLIQCLIFLLGSLH